MKARLMAATAVAALVGVPAWAAGYSTINDAKSRDNQRVVVSGIITNVDARDEFTITDRSGDIEAKLTNARSDLDVGDYVTVTGTVDPGLMGTQLTEARVNVIRNTYADWHNSYRNVYRTDYNLGALDENFRPEDVQNQ